MPRFSTQRSAPRRRFTQLLATLRSAPCRIASHRLAVSRHGFGIGPKGGSRGPFVAPLRRSAQRHATRRTTRPRAAPQPTAPPRGATHRLATQRVATRRSRRGIRMGGPDAGSRGPTPCATLRRAPHRVSPQRTFPRRLASFFRHGIQRLAGCRVERLNAATQRASWHGTAPPRNTTPRRSSHRLSTRHPGFWDGCRVERPNDAPRRNTARRSTSRRPASHRSQRGIQVVLDAGSRGPSTQHFASHRHAPRRTASCRTAPLRGSPSRLSTQRIVLNQGDNPCSNHRVFWPRISRLYVID